MKLEDQVTNLELSKKLKELGVKHVSVFYWYQPLGKEWSLHYIDYNHQETDTKIFLKMNSEAIAAFTVAELGELLPDVIGSNSASGTDRIILMGKIKDQYQVFIQNNNSTRFPLFYSDKEANARAFMLIHLLENGMIENEI